MHLFPYAMKTPRQREQSEASMGRFLPPGPCAARPVLVKSARLSGAQSARSISSPLCRRSQRGRSLLDLSFESSSLPILAHIRPLLNSQLHSATAR